MRIENTRFAATMIALREDQGMTQTRLAQHMKGAGFPFHQQTIQRIESGLREVRLNEAFEIAQALSADVTSMCGGWSLQSEAIFEVERMAAAVQSTVGQLRRFVTETGIRS